MLSLETEEERIVAILHDVVEDTRDRDPLGRVTFEKLKALGYPEKVIAALECVTKDESRDEGANDDEVYAAFIERVKEARALVAPPAQRLGSLLLDQRAIVADESHDNGPPAE